LLIGSTLPNAGVEAGAATSTSPSASVSLSSTGSTVVRPGRTPYWSSCAIGGVFWSVRSGSVVCTVSSVVFSSSSPSPSGGVMSCQLSTRCIESEAIHAAPPKTSLSTTTSRLTRKRSTLVASTPGTSRAASSASPGQSRTNRPLPDQAP
jgi:hypothetical protein